MSRWESTPIFSVGLGRAVLTAALHAMRAAGATRALVETYSLLDPAQELYHALGFRLEYQVRKYYRKFG